MSPSSGKSRHHEKAATSESLSKASKTFFIPGLESSRSVGQKISTCRKSFRACTMCTICTSLNHKILNLLLCRQPRPSGRKDHSDSEEPPLSFNFLPDPSLATPIPSSIPPHPTPSIPCNLVTVACDRMAFIVTTHCYHHHS